MMLFDHEVDVTVIPILQRRIFRYSKSKFFQSCAMLVPRLEFESRYLNAKAQAFNLSSQMASSHSPVPTGFWMFSMHLPSKMEVWQVSMHSSGPTTD